MLSAAGLHWVGNMLHQTAHSKKRMKGGFPPPSYSRLEPSTVLETRRNGVYAGLSEEPQQAGLWEALSKLAASFSEILFFFFSRSDFFLKLFPFLFFIEKILKQHVLCILKSQIPGIQGLLRSFSLCVSLINFILHLFSHTHHSLPSLLSSYSLSPIQCILIIFTLILSPRSSSTLIYPNLDSLFLPSISPLSSSLCPLLFFFSFSLQTKTKTKTNQTAQTKENKDK